ncbi:MAG: phosphatase PAP2 family protein [Oscillospiraceae bacterium]|nr:phosphatase PAP2 family protein [Oscillospiraceae bacterium]
MKKPVVDYRNFRFSKITSPEYSHLLLLSGWIVYFALYFLTENLIPAESCYPVHCFLDDIIPFCEYFIIPYFGWYLLIVFSLGYFLLYDVESFKKLQIFIMITQGLAMAAYILFPTRQDLRPEFFERENIFTALTGMLYSLDTNTGVCPSLHVAYSIGIASVWLKYKPAARWFKALIIFFVAMICLSTMFLKQHSAVDFFAALPVCLFAEIVLYKDYWKESKLFKKR